MWRRLDPLVPLEQALSQRPPAKTCCGFWSLELGTHVAVRLLIFEAAAQLILSFLRPSSLWMMTPYVFFCFVTQDVTRVLMLGASLWTLRALRRGRGVVGALRLLFRMLVVLSVLELVEMILKLGEEEAICEHDMQNRGEDAVHACEVINDVGEIVLSIATVRQASRPPPRARPTHTRRLPVHPSQPSSCPSARQVLGLSYVAWLVHSFARFLKAGTRGPQLGRPVGLERLFSSGLSQGSAQSPAEVRGLPPPVECNAAAQPDGAPAAAGERVEMGSCRVVAQQGVGLGAGTGEGQDGDAHGERPGDGHIGMAARPASSGVQVNPQVLLAVQRRISEGGGLAEGVASRRAEEAPAAGGEEPSPRTSGVARRQAPAPAASPSPSSRGGKRRSNPGRWVRKRAGELARAVTASSGGRRNLEEELPQV